MNWLHAAVGATVIALAGSVWLQTHRLSIEQAAHAQTREQYRTYQMLAERQAEEAAEAARVETDRRLARQQEAIDDALEREKTARAAADRAAAAGQRLRAQIAAITAACRAAGPDPAAAGERPPADATADLLADVQRRLGEAADRIARFADDAHRAGTTCERSYDALDVE
jgi:hypothetical protein